MGPNAPTSTLAWCSPARRKTASRRKARCCSTARTFSIWSRTSALPPACSSRSISDRDPGVATMTFLRTALNAQRKKRGEGEFSDAGFPQARAQGKRRKLNIDQDMLRRGINVSFFREREEAQRDLADGAARTEARGARRNRFRPRYRCAAHRVEGVNRHYAVGWSFVVTSALPAASSTISCLRRGACAFERPHRTPPAAGARA